MKRSDPPRGYARTDRAPSREGAEAIEVHTSDGRALRATVREPPRGVKAQGVAVLAHAMFARRGEWERAGFAAFLAERGWRTIAFDYRGHGESGPSVAQGGTWTYDDLVRLDLPAVIEGARARARRGKVVVVGHSLGGHTSIAAQGVDAIEADAFALVASSPWLRAIEPWALRWVAKRATMAAVKAVVDRVGHFPARALRQGSDDEAAPYMRATTRTALEGWWGSEDRRVDYWEAAARVRAPAYALVSDGDTMNAHPECAALFALHASSRVTVDRVRASDDGGPAPGHMAIVTTPAARSAWARLEGWMRTVR